MLRLVNSTFTFDTEEYYPVLRQFKRLARGHCWSCTNSLKQLANFKATPMKKHLEVYLLLAYWKYKPGFSFFLTNKNG